MWAISNFTDWEKKGLQFFAMKSEELHEKFTFIELDNRWKHNKFWCCIQFKSYQVFLNIHWLASKLYSKIKHICVCSYLICMLCIICFNSIVIFDFKIKSLMYAQWNWALFSALVDLLSNYFINNTITIEVNIANPVLKVIYLKTFKKVKIST